MSTQTTQIRLSESLVNVYPSGTDFDNYKTRPFPIAMSKDFIGGISILIPQASWEEVYYLDAASVTQSYRLTCLELVGKTNDAAFKGAETGQVLLQAVSGQQEGSGPFRMQYSFLYMPDESVTFKLADGTTQAVSKVGWQIFDAHYVKAELAGQTVQMPDKILVHQVYKSGDMSELGIGT